MDQTSASAIFPYLRSCKEECSTPISGESTGEIPGWLKGNLVRIGSGLLEVGPDKYNHVFDGLALMHRFEFQDGQVKYQSRFLRSDAYKRNMKANRIVTSEFGTRAVPDPCKTIFQRFASLFNIDELTDNDLVNIVLYGGEAYACSETNNVWKIDPENLESIQKVNLRNFVPVNAALAHAHQDTDGTVYNIGSAIGLKPTYSILKFPPKENSSHSPFEKGTVVCNIKSSKYLNASYHHSFGMTENYFVFVEQPLYLSLSGMVWSHFISGSYSEAMHWDPKGQTRFHVVRRSDGCLLDTVYITSAFFVFHHINAYEEGNQLVVDMCCYEDGLVVKSMYIKALEEMFSSPKQIPAVFKSKAYRYVLPLDVSVEKENEGQNLVTLEKSDACAYHQSDGSIFVTREILTGKNYWSPELPRINYEKHNGRKYKYFYAMGKDDVLDCAQVIKVNTENKTVVSWSEVGTIPSEPVFILKPNSTEEDSGVVLATLLYIDDETKVSLIILDAKTMKELARVTFKTNSSVPADFHGIFIPKQ
ncbi:carotenoid-cleaving dioxygenase, mitochondrial-like [Uloborus diversus]|uniref:carotenoid-cleaving dioxygenase, mitochondrial-like n=1 Tax=Uloborus diversus TaxID=327109 RepID=UPI00240A0AA6|nr:carotenoid-cleaving dioxygenase, mitochondrial-like [Uloborus diversus]